MSLCLARLRLSHGWYSDAPADGLGIVPEAETAALLRRYDLWTRFDGGEWSLLTGRVGDSAALLAGLSRSLDGAALRLRFTGDMARLASITALPDNLRTLPHFTTRAFDPVEVDGQRLLRLSPQVDEVAPPASVWLYPDDIAREGTDAIWSIRFSAIALPWVYYVVNRNQNPLHQPFIRTSDGRTLLGPVATRLPDGDAALRFDTGGEVLALSRKPTLSVGLFDRFTSPLSDQTTEICLMRSMPLPGPGSILRDDSGQGISAAATIYL